MHGTKIKIIDMTIGSHSLQINIFKETGDKSRQIESEISKWSRPNGESLTESY
jgi:hypothetical protein